MSDLLRNEVKDTPAASGSRGIVKSPGSGNIKAVSIAEPVDSISPLIRGDSKAVEDNFQLDDRTTKQHRAKHGPRLTGRQSSDRTARSRQGSLDHLADVGYESTASTRANSIHDKDGIVSKVRAWLHQEKARRAGARARNRANKSAEQGNSGFELGGTGQDAERRASDASSEGSLALERLHELLASMSTADRISSRRSRSVHGHSISKLLRRSSTAGSSDTEYLDGNAVVPTCEAILDNSKTLSYAGGVPEAGDGIGESGRPVLNRAPSSMQKEAWKTFKFEIVRLTHTLRLKGWRRVSMEMSNHITVERLSGALTNAVYVVSPPKEVLANKDEKDEDKTPTPHKPIPKLLLRIYGTNVDHLIDRQSELQILRRLARKRIGPRLLGTFTNGRFEEFLHARALNPEDLPDTNTSKQIAKRMRELHEGIDLLPDERRNGPFVWCNLDKWMPRCSQIVAWIDTDGNRSNTAAGQTSERPFVCGTEWSVFCDVLKKYRTWLYEQYGGVDKVKQQLVFAHNDTQYGNLLRMTPSGESPLMLPANQHKQLVVIDFEYASANLPGLEFANHFTEWCYNYHDEKASHACNQKRYPSLEEQKRFIRAYVNHKPHFGPSTSNDSNQSSRPETPSLPQTPSLPPAHSSLSTSAISSFMLDARFPQGNSNADKADEERERAVENEVSRLVNETRMWRLANSAQWVMWGVLQAKIPNLPDFGDSTQAAAIATGPSESDHHAKEKGKGKLAEDMGTDPLEQEEKDMADDMEDRRPHAEAEEEEDGEEDGEFDYLGYAWDRAMFFWGDAVGLGMIEMEELPEIVRKEIKIVDY